MHRLKIFFVCLVLLGATSFSIQYLGDEKNHHHGKNLIDLTEQSFFNNLNFHSIRPNNYLTIKSEELLISNNGNELLFVKPKGFILNSQKLNFKADAGTFIKKDDFLRLKKNAQVRMKKSSIKAKEIDFYSNNNLVKARKDVHFKSTEKKIDGSLIIDSNFLKYYINLENLLLSGNVHGKLKRFRAYQEGIEFNSQELSFNSKDGLVKLNKKVKFKRASWFATAHKGKIFLENHSKKLKYYQLNDDVRLTEKLTGLNSEKNIDRKAFSERLIGYVLEQKIVLFGEPKIYQNGDLIKGTRITLREDKQLIEVENSNSNFNMNKQ